MIEPTNHPILFTGSLKATQHVWYTSGHDIFKNYFHRDFKCRHLTENQCFLFLLLNLLTLCLLKMYWVVWDGCNTLGRTFKESWGCSKKRPHSCSLTRAVLHLGTLCILPHSVSCSTLFKWRLLWNCLGLSMLRRSCYQISNCLQLVCCCFSWWPSHVAVLQEEGHYTV